VTRQSPEEKWRDVLMGDARGVVIFLATYVSRKLSRRPLPEQGESDSGNRSDFVEE
jgi:hypothetical protein